MYLLPKIHKRLSNVRGRSLWDINREASEFLDFHLKPVIQSSKLYIKDSGDFIRKLRTFSLFPVMSFLSQWAW